MSDELPGFQEFIAKASTEDVTALLQRMRDEGLPVEHSFFATIHHKSEHRPDGYTPDDLDQIHASLHDADKARWKSQLEAHLAAKGAQGPQDPQA